MNIINFQYNLFKDLYESLNSIRPVVGMFPEEFVAVTECIKNINARVVTENQCLISCVKEINLFPFVKINSGKKVHYSKKTNWALFAHIEHVAKIAMNELKHCSTCTCNKKK